MKQARRLRFSWRLLLRDWRAGEYRILLAALVIAVAGSTAIGFFVDRLGRGMVAQSAEFLGADLALASPRPVDPVWLKKAGELGLEVAETLEFASVVVSGDSFQLSSVKAVDERFPLRGGLRTAAAPFSADGPTSDGPQPGEAWAGSRLMSRLGLEVGDPIEVGVRTLRVARVLTFEPGAAMDLFGVAPRLLMHLQDLPSTGVIQPGSRLSYQYLFAGLRPAVDRYRHWLGPRLESSQELVGVHQGRRALGKALERAERFLGIALSVATLLAGVAIAMAARRYSERHFDMSAMLRCLGATQRALLGIYLPQLLLIGLVGSAVGCVLGWLAQHGLFFLLADLLPMAPSTAGVWPAVGGFATGLIVLGGFALPPILRLKGVSPLRVLRRDLTPLPSAAWLVYGAAGASVVALIWRYTESWRLTFSVLAGGMAAVAMLGLLGLILLSVGRRLSARGGVAWRFGVNNLWRRRATSVSQILAFAVTLMAMAVIAMVRSDLLTTWQQQLPEDAPNHFVINILPDRVGGVRRFLAEHGVAASQLYPMVRGRLVTIDGKAVREAVSKEVRSDNALRRELNLTWTRTLEDDNHILSGRWWRPADEGRALVSVEARLAQRLGIGLGDELGFAIGGELVSAVVASLRSVEWDSFRPNFYMVFPPGVLEEQPATYMTSFYLPGAERTLLVDLVHRFPALTVLELDLIMAQVERIFKQVTLAVEYVLVFVLLAGFAVLFAALQTSLDERLYEGALLRALGGSRRQLRAGHLGEFAALGLLAGLVAAMGAECLLWALYSQVLHLDYSFNWPLWLATPLSGALLVGSAGYWATRSVVQQSPLSLLKDG